MVNAAIYVYQADPLGDQLTEQVENCKAYRQRQGLHVLSIYQEKSTRDALHRLLADVGTGTFQVVVVSEWIRFSRNNLQRLYIIQQIEAKGVSIRTIIDAASFAQH